MTLNRKKHPELKNISHINIPSPILQQLDNGIDAYVINAGTQEVIKIDLVFDAGSWFQDKEFIASTVNEMLIEGTKTYNSQQIAEKLDFYGAFIHSAPTKDHGNISLYSLKKYLPETLLIFADIVKNPNFPGAELSNFINKKKQQFIIELEKVSNVARREFNEQLFGPEHPYGIKSEAEDYNCIKQQDLIDFHHKYYNSENCKIIISGKVNDQDIILLNQYFGQKDWKRSNNHKESSFLISENHNNTSIIQKNDATQSAIRLGKISINIDHPDFHKLNVVNTLLGGYFGSRLMKTIREEKGYTYGINSILISQKHAGYFVILSEVAVDSTKSAIEDILLEIKKLRTELVSHQELELVKNHMLGEMLRSFDGPLEISSSYRSLIDLDMNPDFFQQAVSAIHSINPEEIKHLTQKYLHEESLVKTIAGKYN